MSALDYSPLNKVEGNACNLDRTGAGMMLEA
jgi:hypothetical protein